MIPIGERLAKHSMPEPNSGCILWLGSVSNTGHGRIKVGDKYLGPHRVAWELANGRPVPPKLHVLHKCDVACCINPAHLSLGTNKENIDQAFARGLRKRAVRPQRSRTAFSLDPDLAEKIQRFADLNNMSLSAALREAVRHFLSARATPNQSDAPMETQTA